MAQLAAVSRKTYVHNDAFWEKATITSPLLLEKRTQQWKLALLAKEGIQLEILLNGPATVGRHMSARTCV